MQHFIIEQSESEFYAPNSSLALVEFTLNRFAALASSLTKTVYTQDVISHGKALKRVANQTCGSHGIPERETIKPACLNNYERGGKMIQLPENRSYKPI
jgi:hypothetical protein